jgi:SAM-dependent methyltransferase
MKIVAPPLRPPPLARCHFYHSVDLPGFGEQLGEWDLRGRFDDYIAREQLAGATLLDVGAATGFLSFEAERRGAVVTSFDVDTAQRWRLLPFADNPDRDKFRATIPDVIAQIRRGYWLCHHLFGSRAVAMRGNIYDLEPAGGVFDVVLLGQVLVHLPDGLNALRAAASVCRHKIIVVEGTAEMEFPGALFLGRAGDPQQYMAWYHYSRSWYSEVLRILGYREPRFSTALYRCRHPRHAAEIALTTIIAER